MTDPWKPDLTALGERTRTGLAPLSVTRAAVANRLAPKERPMRLFKRHPILATLIVLAVALIAAPVAYAIVDRVVLHVDPDRPAPDIERDVQRQLEAAGIPATVRATKEPGKVQIAIQADDPSARRVEVQVGDQAVDTTHGGFRVEAACQLTDVQTQALTATATSSAMVDVLTSTAPTAERTAAIERLLAAAGFHDAEVHVDGADVRVRITAPPR